MSLAPFVVSIILFVNLGVRILQDRMYCGRYIMLTFFICISYLKTNVLDRFSFYSVLAIPFL
jgi:hypothetical protein